ncbi:MAG TPA: HAMP domain-containing sensor histidine kinase [Micromonosporaceae bacterium]
MTSRARTVLLGLLVVVVVIGCASAGIFVLVVGGLQSSQDKQLTARAAAARTTIATAPASAFVPAPPAAPIDPATDNDVFIVILSDDGTPISWTGGRDPRLPAGVLAAARTAPTSTTVAINGVPVRVRVESWHRADLARSGFVVAAQSIRRRRSDLTGVVAVLIIAGIVTLLAAAAGIWWVSRRLQRAHRRTAEALAGQQRFAADASHELRTPLTTILNNASFLRAHPDAAPPDRVAAVADIEAEAARMGRLVGDLLTLARADSGATLVPATVDIGQLTRDACRRIATLHGDRRIHCSAPAPMMLCADGDRWTQLLSILLENAVRHTAGGGNIWVTLIARSPYHVILQVADDGEGIPGGAHERIFDRFYQADPTRKRGGAGLGLSIARWIATAHRGRITAATNGRGGATFTVEISSLS